MLRRRRRTSAQTWGLTRTGRAVAVGAVVLLVGGWALSYQELVVWGVAGLAALAGGLVWLVLPVPLEIKRQVAPVRVLRGDPALGLVEVTNRSRHGTGTLEVSERVGAERVDATLSRVPAGASRRLTYRLPTRRRGVVELGPVRLARRDPLGLVQRTQAVAGQETLWIHPRPRTLLGSLGGLSQPLEAPVTDLRPGGTIAFHALREYLPGDDLRHVHWRSSARTGTLMVRQHIDTSEPHTTVVLDTFRGSYRDAELFEEAVDVAASVAVSALAHGHRVHLHTTSGPALNAKNASRNRCLDVLAGVDPADQDDLGNTVRAVAFGPRSETLVVATGALDLNRLRAAGALRRACDQLVVVALDREGRAPNVPPDTTVFVGANADEVAGAWNRRSRL